jgi:HK97 family phage major capsid protein
MITLKELRQQRSQKAQRGKAALDEHNTLAAKADRSADEDARLAALDAELTELETAVADLDKKIAKEESVARRGALFTTAANPAARSSARTVNEPGPGQAGFKALTEFAMAVRAAQTGSGFDQRLAQIDEGQGLGAAPAGYQQNQGSSGEGFLVPQTFREQIWELTFDAPDLLSLVTPEPTIGNSVTIPKDESTPWGAAGVQAYWRSEAAQLTASKYAINQTTVQLHELSAYVLATQEVLDDAPRLQDRLTRQAARAISWKASDAIMWGDGNGKPLGFMNAASLVTVSKESGQAADTMAVKNILKMSSRVLRQGGRPIWIANSDVEPELAALTIGNIPFFLPNSQPGASPIYEGTIRGKPTMFSEHSSTIGDLGDIVVADLSGYYLLTKQGGGIDFAASIHLFFDYNIQAFRWIFRLGGQPFLSAPVSPKSGTNTKSHFVTLEAR